MTNVDENNENNMHRSSVREYPMLLRINWSGILRVSASQAPDTDLDCTVTIAGTVRSTRTFARNETLRRHTSAGRFVSALLLPNKTTQSGKPATCQDSRNCHNFIIRAHENPSDRTMSVSVLYISF